MGNGLVNDVQHGVVDDATARGLSRGSILAIVVGAVAAHYVKPTRSKLVFGAGPVMLGDFSCSTRRRRPRNPARR